MKQISETEKLYRWAKKNITKVTMENMYDFTWEFSIESRSGAVRFPKKLYNLYRACTIKPLTDEEARSELLSIMNDSGAKYINKPIFLVSSTRKFANCEVEE